MSPAALMARIFLVHWGWSVFGKRRITSLRWSPDGSQIAYTVSKPPVPDDEIFVLTPATARRFSFPTAPAAPPGIGANDDAKRV